MKNILKRLFALSMAVMMLSGGVSLAEEGETSLETAEAAHEWVDIRYGEPTSYGTTLHAAYTERSLTTLEDGKPVALVSVSGVSNAITQIVDLNANKIIHTFYLPTTGYCYYGCVTPDGVIYYQVGRKIYEYDPKEKEPEYICDAPTTRSGGMGGIIWDEETKQIYATSSNTGILFCVDPKVKDVKQLTQMMHPGGGLGRPDIIGDYVYCLGENKDENYEIHLAKINKRTGETEFLPDPEGIGTKSISYVYTGGKYVFAQMSGTTCYIYDTEAEKWLDMTFQYKTSGMSDIHDNKIYYLWDNYFHCIDIETLEITDFPELQYGSHFRGNGWFVELDDPDLPGYSFVTAQYNGNIYILNAQNQIMKQVNVTLVGSPLEHRISRVGCDDKIYVAGFKGSNAVVLDPETREIQPISAGQSEGWYFDKETGIGYSGNYSGAFFYQYDTNRPYITGAGSDPSPEANPRSLGSIPQNQDRAFGMDMIDSRWLIVGTLSKAGTTEGALTVWDMETNQMDVYQHIIPNHSLLTVTHKDHIIYAGTTVTGGSGSTPKDNTGHVFAFDLDTREIIKDIKISIPGINGTIGSVHGLRISPYDGLLYGAASGCDFVMDPETLELLRWNIYGECGDLNLGTNSQSWHEYYMEFDPQTKYLIRQGDFINTDTMEIVVKNPVDAQFAGLDSKGNAWFVRGNTEVLKVPVIRGDDKSYLIQGMTFFKTGDSKIYKNAEAKDFSSYEDNGRIMVPVRNVTQSLGGSVTFDAETQTATVSNASGETMSYLMNDNKVTINGEVKKFGVTMKLENGVSYLPMQNLCDFFGKELVEIDGVTFMKDAGAEFSVSRETMDYILSEVYYEEK